MSLKFHKSKQHSGACILIGFSSFSPATHEGSHPITTHPSTFPFLRESNGMSMKTWQVWTWANLALQSFCLVGFVYWLCERIRNTVQSHQGRGEAEASKAAFRGIQLSKTVIWIKLTAPVVWTLVPVSLSLLGQIFYPGPKTKSAQDITTTHREYKRYMFH